MELLIFGLIVIGAIAVLFYFTKKEKYSNLPLMTYEELAKNNGENGKVYIGVNGLVFDVSSCEAYFPGGNYQVFAGKDGTVALAKMSLKAEDMNIESVLSPSEVKTLEEWIVFYRDRKKYPIVGRLEKNRQKKIN